MVGMGDPFVEWGRDCHADRDRFANGRRWRRALDEKACHRLSDGMLLSIATTHQPATDLGYLLHKHPDRLYETALNFGTAWVYYPEAGPECYEAALLLDVDP